MNKKRIVPILNINIENGSNEQGFKALSALPEVRNVVMGEVINAVDEGINQKRKEVGLFKLDHSEFMITIKQEKWSILLNNALEYFLTKEDYTSCIKCRDLINKL